MSHARVVEIFWCAFVSTLWASFYVHTRIKNLIRLKKLVEISDCPFKFTVDSDDDVRVRLTSDTTLWCDYTLGIRSDGIYGIIELRLLGINNIQGKIRHLKVGQSVFPIIKAVDEFVTWAEQKPFDTHFQADFKLTWDKMRQNLDNLRYLEAESKDKEEKSK
jgi:hypothetical protein